MNWIILYNPISFLFLFLFLTISFFIYILSPSSFLTFFVFRNTKEPIPLANCHFFPSLLSRSPCISADGALLSFLVMLCRCWFLPYATRSTPSSFCFDYGYVCGRFGGGFIFHLSCLDFLFVLLQENISLFSYDQGLSKEDKLN